MSMGWKDGLDRKDLSEGFGEGRPVVEILVEDDFIGSDG